MPVFRALRASFLALGSFVWLGSSGTAVGVTITPQLTLTNPSAGDQDDLCIWLHPTDASLSTFITADKHAGRLFVYDLQGKLVQELPVSGQPGNIDLRYGFPLNGEVLDIVAFNNRSSDRLHVYKVSHVTRQLTRIDGNDLAIGSNYGVGLYKSPSTKAFHAFVTAESGSIKHYELFDSGGVLAHSLARSWSFGGRTEGCVCDDETGQAYFGEETTGIWKIGAEPWDPTSGTLIAAVGDASGLGAEVEGLALYYAAGGAGYLFAVSQGQSRYYVYDRAAPHAFVLQFDVAGALNMDGIDVTNVPLGAAFPFGAFASHDDSADPKPIRVCAYEDLGLIVDTISWDPRQGSPVPAPPVGEPAPASMRIGSSPNPSRADMRLRYELASPGLVALQVYDPAGRLVRRLIDRHFLGAGVHTQHWDGRDGSGRPVAAGPYFYRLSTDRGGSATGKATIVR